MPMDMRPLRLANETIDSYSAEFWGPVEWVKAAQMLCDMGLDDQEIRGVLRSKMTRHARDAFDEPSTYLGVLCHMVSGHLANKTLRDYVL